MKGSGKFAAFLSGLCVLAAVLLLVGVCGYCYPQMGDRLKEVVGGMEDGPVREAFGVLSEGLQDGQPIKETVAKTAEILFE